MFEFDITLEVLRQEQVESVEVFVQHLLHADDLGSTPAAQLCALEGELGYCPIAFTDILARVYQSKA